MNYIKKWRQIRKKIKPTKKESPISYECPHYMTLHMQAVNCILEKGHSGYHKAKIEGKHHIKKTYYENEEFGYFEW